MDKIGTDTSHKAYSEYLGVKLLDSTVCTIFNISVDQQNSEQKSDSKGDCKQCFCYVSASNNNIITAVLL